MYITAERLKDMRDWLAEEKKRDAEDQKRSEQREDQGDTDNNVS